MRFALLLVLLLSVPLGYNNCGSTSTNLLSIENSCRLYSTLIVEEFSVGSVKKTIQTQCSYSKSDNTLTCEEISCKEGTPGSCAAPLRTMTTRYDSFSDFVAERELGVIRAVSTSDNLGNTHTFDYDTTAQKRLVRQSGPSEIMIKEWDELGRPLTGTKNAKNMPGCGSCENILYRRKYDDGNNSVTTTAEFENATGSECTCIGKNSQSTISYFDLGIEKKSESTVTMANSEAMSISTSSTVAAEQICN